MCAEAEADQGLRPGMPTSAEREEIRQLRRENFELLRANEILKSASVFFAKELDGGRFGVEPICSVLGVSASAYASHCRVVPPANGSQASVVAES